MRAYRARQTRGGVVMAQLPSALVAKAMTSTEKMAAQLTLSAGAVVRERAKLIEQVVKARDGAWSDDPGDHSARGRACGNGLGIILGIARRDVSGEQRDLKPDERTEAVLDLHGIHAAEATEILEEFLLAVRVIPCRRVRR
jgi:hypothetical protein